MEVHDGTPPTRIAQKIVVLQIIVAALTAGVTIALAVVAFMRLGLGIVAPRAGETPIVTYIAIAVSVVILVARPFILSQITSAAVRALARELAQKPPGADKPGSQPTELASRLFDILQLRTIVGCAFIESLGFFFAIAYFLENSTVALAVGVLTAFGLAAVFPTRSTIEEWLDEQRRRLAESR